MRITSLLARNKALSRKQQCVVLKMVLHSESFKKDVGNKNDSLIFKSKNRKILKPLGNNLQKKYYIIYEL